MELALWISLAELFEPLPAFRLVEKSAIRRAPARLQRCASSMRNGSGRLMMAEGEMLYSALAMFAAISFLCLWRWEAKKLHKKRNEHRDKAYAKLAAYRSHSDHPKYEFSGKNVRVVFRKEEFSQMDGRLAGSFIYLCRNAFDEYFFCVIDIGLSAVHIPKERALHFLKDFPKEYAAEIDYLAAVCQ